MRSSSRAEVSTSTRDTIGAAVAAIASAGQAQVVPSMGNARAILPQKLKDEVMEDAEEALKAALGVGEQLS
ncbi:hypothetical protein [Methylobacterium sp. CM6257]|jgi:hypothetical protein